MAAAVRTRRATVVSLPSGGAPPCRVPLAPFDAYWVALPPVRHVFFFAPPPLHVTFADIARALRSSLAAVLPAFYPFAGELVYSPEPRTAAIVCSEGAGVEFVEAETLLEFARLVKEGAEHDLDALVQLVPDIRRDELPAPVMALQVTEFVGNGGGGAIALGVAFRHAAADGRGFLRFLQTWAAAAVTTTTQGSAAEPVPPPIHDRSLVRFHGDEELGGLILQHRAPDLPRIVPKQIPSSATRPPLSRRTFTFTASAVRRLKQRLAVASGMAARTLPSTMAVLAAHGWVSIARASGFAGDNAPVHAVFLADIRGHMSPPVPGTYGGNCIVPCSAALGGAELAGAGGHARALAAIGAAVEEARRDPLGDRGRWGKIRDAPPGRAVILAGSPSFVAYAMDFGFGRPAWTEVASMNHDGEVFLIAGREVGSVQASVAIDAGKMGAFREMFVLDSRYKSGDDGCSRL
ncbi:unnamed protein product [Urochloa humidicola]